MHQDDIINLIDSINWVDFDTVYGNASPMIPQYLKDLFSSDWHLAMKASHELWSSLCHQHVYVSSAALPAYDIFRFGLLHLHDAIKIELLDIFLGFTVCTKIDDEESFKRKIYEKLLQDLPLFQQLANHSHEDISYFAQKICDYLENKDRDTKDIVLIHNSRENGTGGGEISSL